VNEEFCHCDLWAAEAYLTALDANETKMLDMLHRGEKIHNWMWEETNKMFPQEVKDNDFVYKDAKQVVHLSNYGGGADKMHKENGLPLYVCQWMESKYHTTFPGIRMRMQRIEQELRATRTLTSLLGRKKIFFSLYNQEMLNQAYAWPSQSVIGELTLIALTKLYWMGIVHTNLKTKSVGGVVGVTDFIHNIPWTFPAMNTHDGMAIRCHKGNRKAVTESVRKAFNIPMKKNGLEIVIPVEIGWGDNFNDVSDVQVLRY
jgi:hypothetical protein